MIAHEYLSLPPKDRARLDPMITGFNPTDMYAVDHIRRVLEMYPGRVQRHRRIQHPQGIRVGKSRRRYGDSLNPALDRIFDFAGEVGMPVIFHSDIDVPFTKRTGASALSTIRCGTYSRATRKRRSSGLIRVSAEWSCRCRLQRAQTNPTSGRLRTSNSSKASCPIRKFSNVYFDISWDELAKYAVANPDVIARVAAMFDKYPDRFLFGTDNVAPPNIDANVRVFRMWDPIFAKVRPATKQAILFGNYERIFDGARTHVREWERNHVEH